MGTTRLPNTECGHLVLAWPPEDDAKMESIIQHNMDRGVTFLLLEPEHGGLVPPTTRRLTTFEEAKARRALRVENVTDLTLDVTMLSTSTEPVATTETKKPPRRAKSAKEAAAGNTVAVPQLKGG